MTGKIKAVIIDDEKLARDIIRTYLKKFDNVELLAECSNGFEGLKAIGELNPDLIFLDIQMPKLSGFEMLEVLENPPQIIFTTAFDQYALRAFEVNATDYLLKPFSEERFADALGKVIRQMTDESSGKQKVMDLMKQIENREDFLERVVVKTNHKIVVIPADNIMLIEAQDDYAMIHTDEGRLLKQKTMKFFEENLNPEEFIRIHRSYIVKLSFIQQIELFERDSYRVHLKNDMKLPVSKSGYQRLKELFK